MDSPGLAVAALPRDHTTAKRRTQQRTVKQRHLIRALERSGFHLVRSKRELIYTHTKFGGCVSVPNHQRDIRNKTLANIRSLARKLTGADLDL